MGCKIERMMLVGVALVAAATLTGCPPSDNGPHGGQAGSLQVTLAPEAAVAAGAVWRVDEGAWQGSGATIDNLSLGNHQVQCQDVTGWISPLDQTVTVVAGLTSITATYTVSGEGEGEAETQTFAGIEFVRCPAGVFMMGAFANEQDSQAQEHPQHEVTLTRDFWISKYQVTQAQWQAVMGANPSRFTGDDQRPVEQVSWNMIAGKGGFIDKLNTANPGMGFRLPTEAEWEYACRARTTTRYYWGNDPSYSHIGAYAWFEDNSGNTTHPAGQKLPNAFGLYDMIGNVWEWVQDWYEDYGSGAATDPQGPTEGVNRVVRGGGWDFPAKDCRSASRYVLFPVNSNEDVGFRLAKF